jgi:hypothetical protein
LAGFLLVSLAAASIAREAKSMLALAIVAMTILALNSTIAVLFS